MATLPNVPNDFVAGTNAQADQVDANFQHIVDWVNGQNIQQDNFGTMSGAVEWNISTGVLALDITNSGDQGSIEIVQSSGLNPNRAGVKISHTSAETSGDGALFVELTNASSTMAAVRADVTSGSPAFLANQSGSGNNFRAVNSGGGNMFAGNNGSNDVYRVSNTELLFQPNGTQTFRATASGVQVGDGSGPLLTQNGAGNDLELDGTLKIGGASGITLSDNSGKFDVTSDTLVLNSSLELLNVSGNLASTGASFIFDRAGATELRLTAAGGDRVQLRDSGASVLGSMVISDTGTSSAYRVLSGSVSVGGFASSAVAFSQTFSSAPVVMVTPINSANATSVNNVTTSGVDVTNHGSGTVTIQWMAYGRYT